jgi:gamma-glutamylcysteine synthetase
MPRPKKTIRSVHKNISLPEDLVARLELELYSEAEERIPQGAQQEFFTMLLRNYFSNKER